jgi:hypothetical protein
MEKKQRRLTRNFNIIESKNKTTDGVGLFVIHYTDPETRNRRQFTARYYPDDAPTKINRKRQNKQQAYEIMLRIQKELRDKHTNDSLL